MPYRKPKRSYVLPVVTTLAVAAPLAVLTMSDSPDYRSTTGTELAAVPAQLAEVVLNSTPDIVLPLRELTGLDLPDLHLSDLRMLPLPASLPIPEGLPLPPGVELPKEIPLPRLNSPTTPGQQSAPGQFSTPGSNATPGQSRTPFPGQATAPGQANTPGQATYPGQATTPGQATFPGQATTPGQATVPGQATAPAPNAIPGQTTAPGQATVPGQAAAPGQTTFPGQATAPAPNAIPGQAATPGQATFPGQAAAPVPGAVPGQAVAPAPNAASGQAAAPGQFTSPGQGSFPGQAVAPGQSAFPGQAAGPGQAGVPGQAAPNAIPGQAAAPAQNTAPGPIPAQAPAGTPAPNAPAPGIPADNSGQSQTPATVSGQSAESTPGAMFVADPSRLEPGTTPDTPALAPGAVPPNLVDQVGAQVKELSRDTPFSVVAVTAANLADTKTMVRARQSNGSWGPWFSTEPVDTRRTDHTAPGGKTGTEPIYVGTTKAVQLLTTRKPAAATAPDPTDAAPLVPRSDDPAQMSGVDLTAVLIDPGRGAIDGALHKVAAALPGGGPTFISREGWGADESIRCDGPTYDDGPGGDGLGGITVHHTAGRNDYSKEESAGIVRAIYTYHAQTLGWCDIGYNALVDKYGQVFEGRFGGLDRAVQGAHAGGFNENTAGVALMGNYMSESPTAESIDALGSFIGWRAKIAHLDPIGYTTMYSEGTEYTSYAMGQAVNLPIVFAHRDVGNTSCPGDALYGMMDRIRTIAAGTAGGFTPAPSDYRAAPPSDQGTGTAPAPQQAAPQQATPPQAAPQRPKPDLTQLAALAKKLFDMVDQNPIAKHWVDKGGARGPLGAVQSEPQPAAHGQQYARFANGYVYTAQDGQIVEVLGAILDRFLQLGGDAGVLGLPTSNAYTIPNGLRSDFQNGSLILNQMTGIVTTVWKTYNDTYQQEVARSAPVPAPAPAPAAVPAPAVTPPPAESSAPAEAPAAAQAPLQIPSQAEVFAPDRTPAPAG
ncbi:N-acetylmuramoyl-L-alanine amidase [Nocardia sp. NPDC049149]|uniref:N-acetylmuramoyl-L-alanine amidase n=1 Tax=Nocardia sp. NPDC049149 TaxID=3364315 RepID=UPI00371BC959